MVGIGTAILGLLGNVIDGEKESSDKELDDWMDANKDLLSSNMLPLILMGTVTIAGVFAIAISRNKSS